MKARDHHEKQKKRETKAIPFVKGHLPTGVVRSSGKLLLVSAAYQIFAVGMISGSLMAQAPDVGSGVCVMYHGTPPPSVL
jgi:hypothetical protein